MEQIGVFILLALFWAVQLIVRWLRGRAEPPPAPAPLPTPPPARRQAPVPDDEELFVRAPRPAPPPVPAAAPRAAARPAGPPPRRRTALGGRRDLRRAIVLREVLGPCRAMDASER